MTKNIAALSAAKNKYDTGVIWRAKPAGSGAEYQQGRSEIRYL
jgi:hypothetical protein